MEFTVQNYLLGGFWLITLPWEWKWFWHSRSDLILPTTRGRVRVLKNSLHHRLTFLLLVLAISISSVGFRCGVSTIVWQSASWWGWTVNLWALLLYVFLRYRRSSCCDVSDLWVEVFQREDAWKLVFFPRINLESCQLFLRLEFLYVKLYGVGLKGLCFNFLSVSLMSSGRLYILYTIFWLNDIEGSILSSAKKIKKMDETRPSYCGVMFWKYPVWKFMKHGPWRKKEGCILL